MTTISKITVALAWLLTGCNGGKNDDPVSSPEKGIAVNGVLLKDLDGQSVNLKKYKGRTIFLNFWATWCKPCKEEMPSIERAQKMLLDENIIFLMASGESIEDITEFKSNNDYPFSYTQIENSGELDILAMPTTFIFDASGKLVFSEMGSRQWDSKSNIDLLKSIINQK